MLRAAAVAVTVVVLVADASIGRRGTDEAVPCYRVVVTCIAGSGS